MGLKRESSRYSRYEEFKVSPSLINNFMACPRCSYLERVVGVKPIGSIPLLLNTATDTALDNEFEYYSTRGLQHPIQKEYNLEDIYPYDWKKYVNWINGAFGRKSIRCAHESTNFVLQGAPDDIWIDKNTNQLIIVDFKSTANKTMPVVSDFFDTWKIAYKRQIEIYKYILVKMGHDMQDIGYIMYVVGDPNQDMFEGKINFQYVLNKLPLDTSWIDPQLDHMYTVFNDRYIPESGEGFMGQGCSVCEYVRTMKEEGLIG